MKTIKDLIKLDEYLTHKISICANKNNKNVLFNYLRKLLIICELSFHGIPWFVFVIYLLITNNDAYGQICRPILAGNFLNNL
jgi:hypothetical protein